MTSILSINELYDIKKNICKNHIKTYNHVVSLCNKKIKRIAEHGGYTTFYSIPNVIIGLPLYNIEECVSHLVKLYKKSGYRINKLPYPNTNIIYLSWDPNDIKPNKKLEINFAK